MFGVAYFCGSVDVACRGGPGSVFDISRYGKDPEKDLWARDPRELLLVWVDNTRLDGRMNLSIGMKIYTCSRVHFPLRFL